MYDVTAPGAQYALDDMSDLLSVLSDSQAPSMPPPNVANKSATKKTAEKKDNVDLGPRLAKRKSQDFKSKIAAWDAQGQDEIVVLEEQGTDVVDFADAGIVVEPEEEAGKKDTKANDAPSTPQTPGATKRAAAKSAADRKAAREVDSGRKAWVRRKSKPAIDSHSPAGEKVHAESPTKVDVTPEVKRAVAPKKRVVSDGHWRRDRQKKDTASPEKEEPKDEAPKPVTVRRSVVNAGLKFPPSVQTYTDEQEHEPVRRRHLRAPTQSRSRSREAAEKESTPDYESSGMKVYIKRRKRSKNDMHNAFSASGSSLTAGSSLDRPSTGTDITTPDDTPPKSGPSRPRSEPRERTSRKSTDNEKSFKKSPRNHAEEPEPPCRASRNMAKDDLDMPRPLRTRNSSKSTPKLSKIPATVPKQPNSTPKVFGNRIEGWLSGMQDDPFTEASERSLTPEPLDIKRKKSKPREDTENDYDINRREGSGGPRRSRPSLGQIDTNAQSRPASGTHKAIDDWVLSASPGTPTLRRRGARRNTHSPIKDRTVRGESPQLDDDSTVSELPRQSSRRRAATAAYDKPPRRPSDRQPDTRPLPSRPRAPSDVSEQPTIMEGSVVSRLSDGDVPTRSGSGLKRRLTKHSDLMSVLSLPRAEDHRIKSSRSVRSRRGPSGAGTLGETMNEMSAEELKYQRELRTLVDGVIPVLLTYVLTKKDSKHIQGTRQSSVQDNPELTKPIVDMGVALERLKTQHKRIPMHDPNELLHWAQSSAKVYSDYLQAWRLGFSDVVVNLAPAEEGGKPEASERWDNDLQRNAQGDLLNGNGERVDVAYLLKRPLVRLKNLSKTFKGINHIRPSATAEDMAATYNDLVAHAKQRANDERARLEDEAASAIDPTRARDLHNLGPLSGVNIDPTRSVRARDYFDMQLYHSSGQQLDCKVELIMRDDAPMRGSSGDVLFCEVSTSGRWLLFPPVLATKVSARKGDKEGEIVVMIRGMLSDGHEWREIMSLLATSEQNEEWLDMLASDPMPPRLTRQSSFNALRGPSVGSGRPPSPAESELPLGERARGNAQRWNGDDVNSSVGDIPPSTMPKARASRYHGHQSVSSIHDLPSRQARPEAHARYEHGR